MKPSALGVVDRTGAIDAAPSYLILAREAIARPDTRLVSFDFFDTLVKRRSERPADVFVVVGEHLRESGLLPAYVSAERFAQHRVAAEHAARQGAAGGSGEVTLDQIYAELAFLFDEPARCAEASRHEIAVESETLFANPAVVNLLHRAAKLGRACVVCSDTYFSAQQLRAFLPLPPKVRVFASSEHGVGKAGGLFARMLQASGRAAAEALHFGDNFHADIAPAHALGMRAILLPNGTSTTWEILGEERRLTADPVGSASSAVAERCRGSIIGLRHAALLHSEPGEELGYRGFGSMVMGPVVHGYLRWVVEQARRARVGRIAGLMREGLTLGELYTEFVGDRPVAPLALSRAVLAEAGLAQWRREAFQALLPPRHAIPLDVFARRLGLLARDFPHPWRGRLVGGHDPQLAALLFDHLDTHRALRDQAIGRATSLRARLGLHVRGVLGDLDDPDGGPIALLNLGWGGSIQTRLARLLDLPASRLLGLYLAVNEAAHGNASAGMRMGGYLFDGRSSHQLAERALRSVEVFEQAFTPAQGSVIDYTTDGAPVFAPDPISPAQREQAALIRQGVRDYCALAFADRPADAGADGGADHGADDRYGAARAVARTSVARFCLAPHAQERRLFAHWMHDDNSAGGALDHVCPAIFDFVAGYLTPSQLLDEPFAHTYWPAAVSAPEALQVKRQALAAYRGGESLDLSASPSGVTLRLGLGGVATADTDGLSAPRPVSLNIFHRAAVTWACEASFTAHLELEFSSRAPALVSIDGVVVRRLARRGAADDTILIEPARLLDLVDPGSPLPARAADGGLCLDLAPGSNPPLRLANPLPAGIDGAVDITVLLRLWADLPEAALAVARRPAALAEAGRLEGCVDGLFGQALGRGDEAAEMVLPAERTHAVRGWLLDVGRALAPSEAWLVLEHAGETFRFAADCHRRADLGWHFGRVIAGEAGLCSRVSLAGLRLGEYRIGWAGRFGAAIHTWHDPRAITINTDAEGAVVVRMGLVGVREPTAVLAE